MDQRRGKMECSFGQQTVFRDVENDLDHLSILSFTKKYTVVENYGCLDGELLY